MKQQALAGDITLLFGDESEALTHPYLARAWAKRGCDQSKKRAMIGALDCATRKLIVNTSATKITAPSIPAKPRGPLCPPEIGSPSNGCRNMPRSERHRAVLARSETPLPRS